MWPDREPSRRGVATVASKPFGFDPLRDWIAFGRSQLKRLGYPLEESSADDTVALSWLNRLGSLDGSAISKLAPS